MEGAPAMNSGMPSARSRRFSSSSWRARRRAWCSSAWTRIERDEPLVFPRLLNEVARAALDAFDGEIDVAPGGHHDDGQARIDLLKAREQIETLLAGGGVARVVQVDEQDVVVALAERFEQQLRRAHAVDMDALRLQQQLHGFEDVRLIVGDENPDLGWLTRVCHVVFIESRAS